MGRTKGLSLLVMTGALVLTLTGCVKAPAVEKNAAQTALNNALAAQAENYAANTLTEAKNIWNDAESKMQQKAYTQAKAAYIAAKTAFEKAAGEVEAGKQAVIAENNAVVSGLETGAKELTGLAKKKAKKLQKEMKTAWTTESTKIEEAIKTAKDNILPPAEIQAKLAEAKSLVEKWMKLFKK